MPFEDKALSDEVLYGYRFVGGRFKEGGQDCSRRLVVARWEGKTGSRSFIGDHLYKPLTGGVETVVLAGNSVKLKKCSKKTAQYR